MPDFERSTPATQVVTTAEAKAHLRQDLSVDDDLINGMITAATGEVEAYAQIALIEQAVTASYDGPFSAGRIRLPVGPVASGSSATVTAIAGDGTETVLASAAYSLRTGKAAAVWLLKGVELPTALNDPATVLTIDYSAGFGANEAAVPADLKQAVLDQVAMLYQHRATWRMMRQTPSMSAHAVRIAQRYRRSSV